MHILAEHYRIEFLSTPQLFRIDNAGGESGHVPTLLLKASTLLLKYIVQGSSLELVVAKCDERLLYGIKVFDDVMKPATLWSIAESNVERDALMALIHEQECPLFLFNELALNAAWTTINVKIPREASIWIADTMLGSVDHSSMRIQATELMEKLSDGCSADMPHFSVSLLPSHEWKETFNHYITNQGAVAPIHLFNKDEGGQQEQLAMWLTDNLQPSGAVHSPQIPKGLLRRELTDILLTYQFGTILIESKTLTIFNRTTLPTRDALASDVSKHIEKAVSQLRGAARKLQQGVPVFDKTGAELHVERTQPFHAIVLVPDFDLIKDPANYGKEFIADFMRATKGFLHILDIAELLRVVQSAEMIARRGTSTTPMMAFDYYLMERAKKTFQADMLSIEILLRFSDSE
ncbi:MAG: hypothetical protein C0406_00765 [Sideroxydans sp.]|nr:hypothetical protein [Sideroxydans sp.]